MKFSVNVGRELRCSDCKYFEGDEHNTRYGRCTIKQDTELDELCMHQRSRKICHDFRSVEGKTVKQIMLSDFGDKVVEQVEQDLKNSVMGIEVAGRLSLVQKESVPVLIQQAIEKIVSRET